MNSVFKAPEFFSKILIVGSGSVANRAPLLVGELLRKCEDTIRLSRTFFSRSDAKMNAVLRLLVKAAAAAFYHLLLPAAILRSRMVFVLPSNNTEMPVISFWARIFSKPVLVDYYVSIYEWSCFMQGTGKPDSRMGRFLLKADRIAYQADAVIHCNRVEWDHIGEVIGLPRRRNGFHHLPLFTNFDQLAGPIKAPPSGGPFVFGWWGSSMPLHGLQTIFEAFKLLAMERGDFELHLCFWGEVRRREFEQGKELAMMPWLKVHDALIAADGSLPRFINEKVHIGFSHFGTGPSAEFVYTNKVLECMALGRTALVARLPGNAEYGDLGHFFFPCEPTVEGLVAAARTAMDDGEGRMIREQRCREEFLLRYSETAAKARFHEILERFHEDWKAKGGAS